MRSLLVLPNWVGDTVMALPTIGALAATERKLTALTRPHLVPLVEPLPTVDGVIPRTDSAGETIQQIRNGRFDEAIVLPNSFRSGWLPFRAGIPRRWGYRNASLEGLLRGLILKPTVAHRRHRNRHQVRDYDELLNAMGIDPPSDWTPRIEIGPERRESGRTLLTRARLRDGKGPLLGLFPGAEFGPSKRWPWQRFAELSRKLRQRLPSSQQMIVAGPGEVWLAVRIHEESGKIHPVIGPDLDLGRLATVLTHLDLLVTNDSGPMHLAAALGVPCLAIFGPTNPNRTHPFGERHQFVSTHRWCAPCFRRRCPLLHHRCMREITVEEVLEQALHLLAGAACR